MNDLNSLREKALYLKPDTLLEISDDYTLQDSSPIMIDPLSEIGNLPKNDHGLKTLQRVFEEVIQAMGEMIEVRDVYTAGHQRRVSRISVEIAKIMALPVYQIKGIQLAALIHDIGKLAIPTEILSKPGRLSNAEFDLIKTHSSLGYGIIKDIEFPWPIAQTVLQHHERMNGSGYPNKLTKQNILLEARILSVADVIEAMASNRPYRPAIGINQALEEISRNKYELYDGNVVDACLQLFNDGLIVLQ
jgi:HD-GYP domain-containing protein (c-di-GMP phosphodiesterase class II)